MHGGLPCLNGNWCPTINYQRALGYLHWLLLGLSQSEMTDGACVDWLTRMFLVVRSRGYSMVTVWFDPTSSRSDAYHWDVAKIFPSMYAQRIDTWQGLFEQNGYQGAKVYSRYAIGPRLCHLESSPVDTLSLPQWGLQMPAMSPWLIALRLVSPRSEVPTNG